MPLTSIQNSTIALISMKTTFFTFGKMMKLLFTIQMVLLIIMEMSEKLNVFNYPNLL